MGRPKLIICRPKLIMQSKIHYYSPKLIIKKILLLEVQIFILHYTAKPVGSACIDEHHNATNVS